MNHFKSLQTSHYVQHEDTVAQAKSKVQEKLNQLREQDGGASGRTYSSGGYTSGSTGGNYRYNSGCHYCDQSSSSSKLESHSSRLVQRCLKNDFNSFFIHILIKFALYGISEVIFRNSQVIRSNINI